MTKSTKGKRGAQAGPTPKADPKPDVAELSHDEQVAAIDKAMEAQQAAGIPSAVLVAATWKLAQVFFDSGLFQRAKNPAGVFTIIMFGAEMGLTPMQALTNIDIVDGHPAMSSQLMAAKAEAEGVQIEVLQRDELGCRLSMAYQGKIQEHQFTIDDVNRAQLNGKDNHQKYPRAMMYWRAMSEGLKVVAPGALLKCYTFGELTDDQAKNLIEYDNLPDDFGRRNPAGSTSAPRGSARASSPQSPPADPELASDRKVQEIRSMLASPMCPLQLRIDTLAWLDKHNGTLKDGPAAKAITKLQDYVALDKGGALKPVSVKQLEFLAKLVTSSKIPVEFKAVVEKQTNLTVGQASAWINGCRYYVDAPADQGEDAPPEPDQGAQAEFDRFTELKDSVLALADVKVPPSTKAWAAFQDWLDTGDTDQEIWKSWGDTLEGWDDKEVDAAPSDGAAQPEQGKLI